MAAFALADLRHLTSQDGRVRHATEYGGPSPWPELDGDGADELVQKLCGLQNALLLAGYAAPRLRVESPVGDNYEIDLLTHRAGSVPESLGDGLAVVRADATGLFLAVEVSGWQPFGSEIGPPFGLPLTLTTTDETLPLFDRNGGWLAFVSEESEYDRARKEFVDLAVDAAAQIAADVVVAWDRVPDLHRPAGLGWITDATGWQFPLVTDVDLGGRADELAATTTVAVEWGRVAGAMAAGTIPVSDWVAEHCDRVGHARFLYGRASLQQVFREASSNLDGAIAAYHQRAVEVAGSPLGQANHAAGLLDKALHLTSIALLAEHGVIDLAARLPLRSDAEAETEPEWTTPHLTGVYWDYDTPDVLLVNQAGHYAEGYEYARRAVGSRIEIRRYSWDAELLDRVDGTTTTWTLRRWLLTNEIDIEESDRERLPLPETGTLTVTDTGQGDVDITRRIGSGPDKTFFLGERAAHVTNRMLDATVAVAGRAEYRTLREHTLHTSELTTVRAVIEAVYDRVDEWVASIDAWVGTDLDAISTVTTAGALQDELVDLLTGHYSGNPGGDQGDLLPTLRRRIVHHLDLTGAGDVSYWRLLVSLVKGARNYTRDLQAIFGLTFADPSGERFEYQWRMTDIVAKGVVVSAGGSGGSAVGVGDFEIRRVETEIDEEGERRVVAVLDGPHTFDIYLWTVTGGIQFDLGGGTYDGWGDVDEWQSFYAATDRDIVPHMHEATLRLVGFESGALILQSSSSAEVVLQPSDELEALYGRIDGTLLEVSLFDIPDDPDGAKSWWDSLAELPETLKKAREKGADKARKIKPSFMLVETEGWILDPAAPEPEDGPAVLLPGDLVAETTGQALFESGDWTIDAQFLPVLRRFLAAYLPVLRTSLGSLSVEGHASQRGSETDNLDLSRERAITVLDAIRHILGTQLAAPIGRVQCRYFGEEFARGAETDDLPGDRRVDIRLGGRVVMSV